MWENREGYAVSPKDVQEVTPVFDIKNTIQLTPDEAKMYEYSFYFVVQMPHERIHCYYANTEHAEAARKLLILMRNKELETLCRQ